MVRVITDSTSSIPKAILDELGIEVLSLIINRKNIEYVEADTDLDAFYQDIYDMADDIPTSSQPSPDEVKQVLEACALAHEDVLGIFISSKMSGTFESFVHLAREISSEHPTFNFIAIDSTTNCMEMGFAVIAAARAASKGCSLQECAQEAEKTLRS